MSVINPAELFLAQYNPKSSISLPQLLKDYANHLLLDAGTDSFPVQFESICSRYQLKIHKIPLLQQRGAVTPDLEILINSYDSQQVQIYSQAHELVEILVDFIKRHDLECLTDEQIRDLLNNKEHWCEVGAADILMPMTHFYSYIKDFGYTLRTAKALAQSTNLSLLAITRRMLDTNLREAAVVVWCWGHKPSESVPSETGQLNFLGDKTAMDPPKKLRVERIYRSQIFRRHIRQYKSVGTDTVIGKAFNKAKGTIYQGFNYLEITSNHGNFWVEAMPIYYADQSRVLSLIFFDQRTQ